MPDHLGRLASERVPTLTPADSDEAEVVRRAQLGSSAAFTLLVMRRGPDLYRFLVLRLRNENDARDAFQETMTAAWKALPKLREPDRFWSWLMTIAARKASAIAHARVPRQEHDLDLLAHHDKPLLEVWDAVGRLPALQRDVLVLRYRLQLSERETAEALGIRVSTVKSRAFEARKALKELLT
jgi:RNA polymerase sigma-70 factor (ECF subfamily)